MREARRYSEDVRSARVLIGLLTLALLPVLAACGGDGGSSTVTETATVTAASTQQEDTGQQTQQDQQTQDQQQTQQDQQSQQQGQSIVYTEDSTRISVQTGDSFTIELPVNPSTGYRWQVDLPMGYVQVSDEILQPEDAGNAVGQGTTERWVFSADTQGTATIDFKLLPPGSDTPEKTVTFTVDAG